METKRDCKVNILIPAYNAEAYIRECLDSLVRQTLKDIQITVLDDGSADRTGAIADEYAEKYENVTALHQKNSGVTKSRTRLMKIARGEYIGWVDADDFTKKEMYEKLYESAVREEADVVSCDYSFYPKEIWTKEKWFKPYEGRLDWYFLTRNNQHWNKIVRREMLERYDIVKWNDECGEITYALALLLAKKIVTISEPLYYYRVGHTSLSNNFHDINLYERNVETILRFREVIRHYGLDEKWGRFYDSSISITYIQAMIVSAFNGKKALYTKNRKQNKKLKMNRNEFVKLRMDTRYGRLKSWIMRRLVPSGYWPARVLSKIALK